MTHAGQESLLESLRHRYATKRFDCERKIPEPIWETLKQVLVLSPSSYGLQPYRFVVPTSQDLRLRLKEASRGQPQVTDASHLLVFAAREEITSGDVDHFLKSLAGVRNIPLPSMEGLRRTLTGDLVEGPRAAIAKHWAARQAYLALGNLLASAAALGIDACPMEGFSPSQYDEILGLVGSGYCTVCICALGYRHPDDPYAQVPKFRFPESELFIIK